ncbi:MAG: hypothetical protein JRH11_10385 [Deltaproteobacteria bacterium]|nr:hypothetical protein [Deltaproteobacteria bacterium]
MSAKKNLPWIVWAFITPALIIGVVQLQTGGGIRTPYVVAGVGAAVGEDDHPEGAYFTHDVVAHESFAETADRVEEHIREYPKMMVIGLDGDALEDTDESEREAMAVQMTLAGHAENATTIPILLSLTPSTTPRGSLGERLARLHEWWRRELCRDGEFRVCVDLAAHADDPVAVREAVKSGMVHGLESLGRWCASTQGPR